MRARRTLLLSPALLAATLAAPRIALAQEAPRTARAQRGAVRVERMGRVEHPWGLALLDGERFLVTERNAVYLMGLVTRAEGAAARRADGRGNHILARGRCGARGRHAPGGRDRAAPLRTV